MGVAKAGVEFNRRDRERGFGREQLPLFRCCFWLSPLESVTKMSENGGLGHPLTLFIVVDSVCDALSGDNGSLLSFRRTCKGVFRFGDCFRRNFLLDTKKFMPWFLGTFVIEEVSKYGYSGPAHFRTWKIEGTDFPVIFRCVFQNAAFSSGNRASTRVIKVLVWLFRDRKVKIYIGDGSKFNRCDTKTSRITVLSGRSIRLWVKKMIMHYAVRQMKVWC